MGSPFKDKLISEGDIRPDDGVASIPISSEPDSEKESIMPEIDPVIAKQMDQNFAKFHTQFDAAAQRHNDTAEFITEEVKTSFMLERQLIGAKAAGQLDRDALSKSKLDASQVK